MPSKDLLQETTLTSRPKALLLDLDGTLLNAEDAYSSRAREAIHAAAEIIPVSLSSGRFSGEVRKFARKLNLNYPQIAENGGRIVDPQTGASLYQNDLRRDEVSGIASAISRSGYAFYASEEGHPVTRIIDFQTWHVSIISTCAGTYETAMRLREKADEFEDISASVSLSSLGAWYVMFTKTGVDKGKATEVFAKMVGTDPTEIMAVGDGPNDVEMFSAVGISVAMGHASERVKEHARFVTKDLDNDGLAFAVENLILKGW